MDSKMDSGYIAPGENLAQALEDDYDEQGERLIFHELSCI
jgi:hypothetical protein